MSLVELEQSDFGSGSQLEVAPHLISQTGFHDVENGLLNDDGSIYKRGGSVRHSVGAFGTGAAGKFVWEGEMSVGRRTVIANGSDFGVTAGDAPGTAVVNLGGNGFTNVPGSAVFFQHILWIGGGTMYGGSRKAADYATGTVTATKASNVVVGSGTSWLANIDAGMILRLSTTERAYVVKAVVNDTHIELYEAYEGTTAAGHVYELARLASAIGPYKSTPWYAVAGERLICLEGRRIDFSEPNKPHLFKATIFPQETVVENFHELAEGVTILAGVTLGVDKLLVFHTGGITTFSNMAKSIVDGLGNSQHREDVYSRDVVLWGNGIGIAASRTTFIVPAVDNVYLVDGVSAPVPLGDAIGPRYRERLLEGNTPGGAWVTRSHYFLPIIDSGGAPIDHFVCRLDKPYSFRNKTLYPWSFLTGAGVPVYGTVRSPAVSGERPRVLGMTEDSSLVDALPFFFPEETNATDHDGSVPIWTFLTRDWGVGSEAIARWRKLQMFYELFPVAESSPVIVAEIGTGISDEEEGSLWDEVEWDEFDWAEPDDGAYQRLEGTAPANAGIQGHLAQNEKVWFSNTRARYARFRLSSADPVTKLVLRGLLISPAQPGGNRHSRVN